MLVKLFTDLLDSLTTQNVRYALPLNSVEVQLRPGSLHMLQVVVQGELAEGKVCLAFEELDVLLGALHVAQRLFRDVSLLAVADLLGHLADVLWLETLCGESSDDSDLLLELH